MSEICVLREWICMFVNHGPVVSGKDPDAAVYAVEELEAGAELVMMTRGLSPRVLRDDQVADFAGRFDVECCA